MANTINNLVMNWRFDGNYYDDDNGDTSENFAISRIVTSASSSYGLMPGYGSFYGYKNNNTGPGDDAFQQLYDAVINSHKLLILYFGKDGCSVCNSFAQDFMDHSVIAGNLLKYGDCYNGHFRAKPSTAPKAWRDCGQFLQRVTGKTNVGCHVIVAWGVFEDGTQYFVDGSSIRTYDQFSKWKVNQCDTFQTEATKHKLKNHGSGDINDKIEDAASGFIPGQWYKYSTNLASFEAFIEYARQSKKPVIVLGSAFGCTKCSNFISNVLTKNEMMSWLATSSCLLLHVHSSSGQWTTKPLRLFLDVFNEGKNSDLPMIIVWKDENLLLRTTYGGSSSGTWEDYKKKFIAVIGEDEDKPQPGPNDIKLLSYTNEFGTGIDGSNFIPMGRSFFDAITFTKELKNFDGSAGTPDGYWMLGWQPDA